MRSIYRQLLHSIRTGENTVIATVVRSMGSTPQKPGSSAIFRKDGLIAGTVGGGLLEGKVQQVAEKALETATSGLHYYSLDTREGEDGAICGGEAAVLIDAGPERSLKVLEKLEHSLSSGKEGYIVTLVGSPPENSSVERYWIGVEDGQEIPVGMDADVWNAVTGVLGAGNDAGFIEIALPEIPESDLQAVFIESFRPYPRLVIVGAGHVGKALAHLGNLLEFEVTVVDDRAEFACRENIPDADQFLVKDFGASMRDLQPGPDSFIVIVTRGHAHDAEALRPLIRSGATYIGMIGSKHKVAVMKNRFLEEGWATPEEWARVHTPIGIDIGSISVQEIALSIAAELVKVRSEMRKSHAD